MDRSAVAATASRRSSGECSGILHEIGILEPGRRVPIGQCLGTSNGQQCHHHQAAKSFGANFTDGGDLLHSRRRHLPVSDDIRTTDVAPQQVRIPSRERVRRAQRTLRSEARKKLLGITKGDTECVLLLRQWTAEADWADRRLRAPKI